MKEKNQLYLLYDEACPLCNWYSDKFVQFGFIDSTTRVPFAQGAVNTQLKFDRDLAKNKIALVNATNNTVLYGIDSLLYILGRKMPLLEKIGNFKPVHFLLVQLYNFISYNRKVIAPVHTCTTNCDCAPSISYFWRISYTVFAAIIIHLSVGFYFNAFLTDYLVDNPTPDFVLFGSQFAFQWIFFKLFKQRDFYTYAGHLATVSLIGALILLGLGGSIFLLDKIGVNTSLLGPLGFGAVLTVMLLIHYNRIKKIGFIGYLTLTWIIFRISIYTLVFKLQ